LDENNLMEINSMEQECMILTTTTKTKNSKKTNKKNKKTCQLVSDLDVVGGL
jgi:hypothetical protein